MTEIERFLHECAERGRFTLADHLTLSGYTTDFNKRKSMETQAVRKLTEGNDDQRALLGTVIFPSKNTRAAWAEGVERLEDHEDKPDFAHSLITKPTLDKIMERNAFRYEGTEVSIRDAFRAVATTSRRKQELVERGFRASHDELDYAREKNERGEETIEGLRQEIAYLRHQNNQLLAMIARQSGLVPVVEPGE